MSRAAKIAFINLDEKDDGLINKEPVRGLFALLGMSEEAANQWYRATNVEKNSGIDINEFKVGAYALFNNPELTQDQKNMLQFAFAPKDCWPDEAINFAGSDDSEGSTEDAGSAEEAGSTE